MRGKTINGHGDGNESGIFVAEAILHADVGQMIEKTYPNSILDLLSPSDPKLLSARVIPIPMSREL